MLNDLILEILKQHIGAKHAISWADLTMLVNDDGMNNYRGDEVRTAIESMRDSGAVICSNQSGYFMPETGKELNKFLETYKQPALKRLVTAAKMDAGRGAYFGGQMKLDTPQGTDL